MMPDLLYCRKTFQSTVQRYVASAHTYPEDSIFKSFVKQPYLKGLPIVDDETKHEQFILGVYPLYDRTGITLSDFIPYREKAYNWSRERVELCWFKFSVISRK